MGKISVPTNFGSDWIRFQLFGIPFYLSSSVHPFASIFVETDADSEDNVDCFRIRRSILKLKPIVLRDRHPSSMLCRQRLFQLSDRYNAESIRNYYHRQYFPITNTAFADEHPPVFCGFVLFFSSIRRFIGFLGCFIGLINWRNEE